MSDNDQAIGFRLSHDDLLSFSQKLQDWISDQNGARGWGPIEHIHKMIIFPAIDDIVVPSNRPTKSGLWFLTIYNVDSMEKPLNGKDGEISVFHESYLQISTLRLMNELLAIPDPDLVGLGDAMIHFEDLAPRGF